MAMLNDKAQDCGNFVCFSTAQRNEVLGYFVKCEHTLGYLFKNEADSLMFGILASSVIRGGHDWKNGPVYVMAWDRYRKATQADFDAYRVSSKGHIS